MEEEYENAFTETVPGTFAGVMHPVAGGRHASEPV
jgi:hypothetical protein